MRTLQRFEELFWYPRTTLFVVVLVAGTCAFTRYAYSRSKTDERWCEAFGGVTIPEHCFKHFRVRHCVEWSE